MLTCGGMHRWRLVLVDAHTGQQGIAGLHRIMGITRNMLT